MWQTVAIKTVIQPISIIVKIPTKQYLDQGKYPVIDQGQEFIGGYTNDETGVIRQLPAIIFGDHTRVFKYVNSPFVPGADGVKIFQAKSFFLPKLLFYFLQAVTLPDRGYARHYQYLVKSMIPLPPLAEQKRIVKKIEELFGVIDEQVKRLEATQEALVSYRQSILNTYFKNSKYSTCKIKDLCQVVRGGSPRPAGDPRFYNGTIPFLKVADLTHNSSMFVNEATYTIKPAGLIKTRKVPANTLLLSNSGATLGVPKICTFETTFNDGIAAFLNLPKEALPYHYYFWVSKTKELRAINQGAAQPNLNTTIIENMDIPYPSLPEQKAIVKKIETAFAFADKAQAAITNALEQAKQLKQSILKRAFEGKLVPQDPNDKPIDLTQLKKDKQK